ncbi:hypothetical protein GCM10027174_45450 [Salinifilum aidingensis]
MAGRPLSTAPGGWGGHVGSAYIHHLTKCCSFGREERSVLAELKVAAVGEGTALVLGLPDWDCWLVDDERVLVSTYRDDHVPLGAHVYTAPSVVSRYRSWRDRLVRWAQPLPPVAPARTWSVVRQSAQQRPSRGGSGGGHACQLALGVFPCPAFALRPSRAAPAGHLPLPVVPARWGR